jgi:hypothetical protein
MSKAKILAIRVKEKDLELLKKEAEKERLTMSGYARNLVFRALQGRNRNERLQHNS